MTAHHFDTTWGATIDPAGFVTFRLWAPAQDAVALIANNSRLTLSMRRASQGWFQIQTDAVKASDTYVFRLDDGTCVPDPAARAQRGSVHGPSRLVDPRSHVWSCENWRGRPWEEAVIYELHIGTFTPLGTFDGAIPKLDRLADLGITAIEIMPVAQFAGQRGWGYDGVLLYAPHIAYGGPEGFKRLIDAAHQRHLMVFLDVVYNHFGPEGNYLHLYAPDFFHPERHTPWGAAIAYETAPVRDFFIENALYWLQEYQLDGLRLDAINQIQDSSPEPLLEELARRVRSGISNRHIHLVTEDDRNIVHLHNRDERGRVRLYTAEWNDDVHHAMHVLATGESDGYYQDYKDPVPRLSRALAEGYVYQGEPSAFWDGATRGESSVHLPPTAFVDFLQNHDQIGNRGFGERLTTLASEPMVDLLIAILLLSPHIPLLFMGEEYGEQRPFLYFTDFHGELADLVRAGRRNEFSKWPAFHDPDQREKIPDPNAETTFAKCVLDWSTISAMEHAPRLQLVRRLLRLRATAITPHLASMHRHRSSYRVLTDRAFMVDWRIASQARLVMFANLGSASVKIDELCDAYVAIYESENGLAANVRKGHLPAESVYYLWRLGDAN